MTTSLLELLIAAKNINDTNIIQDEVLFLLMCTFFLSHCSTNLLAFWLHELLLLKWGSPELTSLLLYQAPNEIRLSQFTMDNIPDELLIVILGKLDYRNQGRLLVVSKRWMRIIEELLPTVRNVIISGRPAAWENCKKGLDDYRLYSSYNGESVYISIHKHKLLNASEKRRLFLHKLEGVWYASATLGVIDAAEGYWF